MKYYGHKVHINDIATKVIFYKIMEKNKNQQNTEKYQTFCYATCILGVVF